VLVAVLIGLAAIILWPIGCAVWYRLRSGGWRIRRDTRIAMRSGLCVLLACIFLVGPEWFHGLAQASIEYSSLSTLAWARAGDTIEYGYDANGSLISKVTRNGSGDVTESRAYEYDLRGRLAREVDTGLTPGDPADDAPIAEFAHNSSGIRVKKIDRLASTATYYLIDEQNHTGYAQVLEERTYVIAGGTETLDSAVYYTIGDDVISQTKATYPGGVVTFADTQYLLYDGHGSTRQLLNHTPDGSGEPVVTESYDYDSYGVMLGSGAGSADAAATNLLYCGEQYDSSLSQYYLRARYYDPSNGRFTTLDPYAGNTSDPQSLHKYTYCHNDPVNAIDPSGAAIQDYNLSSLMTAIAITAVVAVICLTVYNGLRHHASIGTIVVNVLQNLATFVLIIGAVVCSGLIAALATGTLIALFITGLIDLVRSWPDMDTTDKVITVLTFLAFMAFAGAVSSATVPRNPSPGTFTPGTRTSLPEGYYSKPVIDMRECPKPKGRNVRGYPRDAQWFWQQIRARNPEYFSPENLKAISDGRSPRVDPQWLKYHPKHGNCMGERLIHHHMARGPYATAIPESVHVGFSGVLHNQASSE